MNRPDTSLPDSLLRSAWSWGLLPFAAWFVSIPFLGIGAFFLPIVIGLAPLGVIGYFQKISLSPTPQQETMIAIIHCFFWLIFATSIWLRRSLSLTWLRVMWFRPGYRPVHVVSGCAYHLGPGLRSDGNWH